MDFQAEITRENLDQKSVELNLSSEINRIIYLSNAVNLGGNSSDDITLAAPIRNKI